MTTYSFLLILVVCILIVMGLFVLTVRVIFRPSAVRRLKQLVKEERRNYDDGNNPLEQSVETISSKLGPLVRFSAPKGPWDLSPLHKDLMAAGYRGLSAGIIYLGLKTLLTFFFPVTFMILAGVFELNLDSKQMGLFVLVCAAFGYLLPNFILSFLVTKRRRELFENFPDALDLMRICVEAGLALDMAIARVGEELRIRSKALSDEFRLVSLEQRAGATRNLALNNMALRVGIQDIDALVATLVQADRFGTSIADSLRVHSENLRLGRRLRAEEQAAKIPTKILLPLILCIFPLLFILILTPAIANIQHGLKGEPSVAESTESEQSP